MLRDTPGIFLRALLTNYEEICILSTPFSFSQKNVRAKDKNISIKFGDVKTTRDYAQRFKFEFDNEIMSEHFGIAQSLSIEGYSAWFFLNPNNI